MTYKKNSISKTPTLSDCQIFGVGVFPFLTNLFNFKFNYTTTGIGFPVVFFSPFNYKKTINILEEKIKNEHDPVIQVKYAEEIRKLRIGES